MNPPSDAEITFWLVALAIAVVVFIILHVVAKRISDDYVESWRDDDKY